MGRGREVLDKEEEIKSERKSERTECQPFMGLLRGRSFNPIDLPHKGVQSAIVVLFQKESKQVSTASAHCIVICTANKFQRAYADASRDPLSTHSLQPSQNALSGLSGGNH